MDLRILMGLFQLKMFNDPKYKQREGNFTVEQLHSGNKAQRLFCSVVFLGLYFKQLCTCFQISSDPSLWKTFSQNMEFPLGAYWIWKPAHKDFNFGFVFFRLISNQMIKWMRNGIFRILSLNMQIIYGMFEAVQFSFAKSGVSTKDTSTWTDDLIFLS